MLAALFLSTGVALAGASPQGSVITFSFLDPQQKHGLHGTLYLPDNGSSRHPALVVIHGTMGIDSRNDFYREALLKEGIATFEVDFKSGIYSSPLNRPHPSAFLPMTFAALKELCQLPSIDSDRVGVMGYSLGGHMAVDAAFASDRKQWMGDERGFAAHVAFYPVCKPYLEQADLQVTGAPMIILYGTDDSYGEGANVPAFKRLLQAKANFAVTTVEYAGASHAFNHNVPPENHWDPVAIGHRSHTAWSADAATDSLDHVVHLLHENLTTKYCTSRYGRSHGGMGIGDSRSLPGRSTPSTPDSRRLVRGRPCN